jgi:hypothetical protein
LPSWPIPSPRDDASVATAVVQTAVHATAASAPAAVDLKLAVAEGTAAETDDDFFYYGPNLRLFTVKEAHAAFRRLPLGSKKKNSNYNKVTNIE